VNTVSIHTPNEGSDDIIRHPLNRLREFQSTLPMKGVTIPVLIKGVEGKFQSTLPMKGVTAKSGKKIYLPARYGQFAILYL